MFYEGDDEGGEERCDCKEPDRDLSLGDFNLERGFERGCFLGRYFVGDAIADQFDVIGDSVCYFAGPETIEESDILSKDSLQV